MLYITENVKPRAVLAEFQKYATTHEDDDYVEKRLKEQSLFARFYNKIYTDYYFADRFMNSDVDGMDDLAIYLFDMMKPARYPVSVFFNLNSVLLYPTLHPSKLTRFAQHVLNSDNCYLFFYACPSDFDSLDAKESFEALGIQDTVVAQVMEALIRNRRMVNETGSWFLSIVRLVEETGIPASLAMNLVDHGSPEPTTSEA